MEEFDGFMKVIAKKAKQGVYLELLSYLKFEVAT
jgi:hypothetical protein